MKRMHLGNLVYFCLLSGLLASAGSAATLYVDINGPDGNGTSWTTARKNLYLAIRYASTQPSVTEIRVAKGRYTPDVPNGDRQKSFSLLRSVAIRGAFAGSSNPSSPDTRDLLLYETILSGDLNGDELNDEDNAYCVVNATPLTTQPINDLAQLDGFTITGGNGGIVDPGGQITYGAGIYCPGALNPLNASSPTIRDCRIIGNRNYRHNINTKLGGGMYAGINASPSLLACTFERNQAGDGGGLYLYEPGEAVLISNCKFIKNTATEVGGGGALITASGGTLPVPFINCIFRQNVAQKAEGGAILATLTSGRELLILNGLFDRNSAVTYGGAVYAGSGTNLRMVNCAFSHLSHGPPAIEATESRSHPANLQERQTAQNTARFVFSITNDKPNSYSRFRPSKVEH
jgi:predicted outer membrane repeat protein